jgi:hypothetical protein
MAIWNSFWALRRRRGFGEESAARDEKRYVALSHREKRLGNSIVLKFAMVWSSWIGKCILYEIFMGG